MNRVGQFIVGFMAAVFFLAAPVSAQESRSNVIESIAVTQQGGVLNVKLGFKEPLAAPPPGFSVAKPARIALDFLDTTNGLGKNSQVYNEGDLKSVNFVQADGRTRVVLNLNQAMNYEASLEGKNLVLALQPSVEKDRGMTRVEHFAQAQPAQVVTSIRDIAFRRGKDGEARITVDLTDPNAGIDIRQQGQSLLVDFVKVSLPEALSKRMDVTDFATPVLSVSTEQKGDLGYGRSAWPCTDEAILSERFGPVRGAVVREAVEEILAVLNAVETDWSALDLPAAAQRAAQQTRERYPFLDAQALAALAWKYSFDWR